MVTSELEEDGMVGNPAPAAGEDESHSTVSHLSVVKPEDAEPVEPEATIIGIGQLRPGVIEHKSFIYAW
jgi:hypothetical protein